jgi:hypothetical protein
MPCSRRRRKASPALSPCRNAPILERNWFASPGPVRMELPIIVVNFLYAILGVALMYGSYRIIDWLTPEMDFRDELKKGNVAVAIFIAALFVSIAIVVGSALR